jgi:hypothetical protein
MIRRAGDTDGISRRSVIWIKAHHIRLFGACLALAGSPPQANMRRQWSVRAGMAAFCRRFGIIFWGDGTTA